MVTDIGNSIFAGIGYTFGLIGPTVAGGTIGYSLGDTNGMYIGAIIGTAFNISASVALRIENAGTVPHLCSLVGLAVGEKIFGKDKGPHFNNKGNRSL